MKQRRLSMPMRWLLLIGQGTAAIASISTLVARITEGGLWGILPWMVLVAVLFGGLVALMNYLTVRSSSCMGRWE